MDYEKKYKEALSRAASMIKVAANEKEAINYVSTIFPELKESEDERVKKRILLSLEKDLMATKNSGCDTQDLEQCIAWLEKQGDQKPVIDFKAKNWYVSKVDGKIHDMTYNPTDKVEPKFKVGSILKHNNSNVIAEVLSVNVGFYCLRNVLGGDEMELSNVEKNFHLWTIADAKDGDVLACGDKVTDCPFIFHNLTEGQNPRSYCGVNRLQHFQYNDENGGSWCYSDEVRPATKEQRDTLFAKMKEAGYEWNAEKKELKKIEESINDEEYGIDGLYHAQRILEKTLGNVDGYQTDDGILEHKCAIAAVNKLYKQKSAEWSDEDKDMIRYIGNAITCEESSKYLEEKGINMIKVHSWLESLKPQIKEWSEEDDYNLQCMFDKVNYDIQKGNVGRNNELIDWLKSLKDRITWKPSKEQIETLEYYMHTLIATEHKEVLFGLYNDLKKL